MKINLEKELRKQKDPALEQQELILDYANEVLKNADEEDRQALINAGLSHNLVSSKNIQALNGGLKASFDTSNIFTRGQIKRLCVKYGLRFLETERFRGNIPLEAVVKLKEYQKKYKLNEKEAKRRYNYFGYYIAAPKSSFELTKRPKDPLLFHYLGNGRYYLIAKWGKDLSYWNLIRSFFTKSQKRFIYSMIGLCCLLAILTSVIFGSVEFLLTAPMLMIVSLATWQLFLDDLKFNEDAWNNPYFD